jgi:hypothetical protein
MSRNESIPNSGDVVVRQHLETNVDLDWPDDDVLQAMAYIHATPLSFGSAMWMLAEFVDRIIREIDEHTGVPYDYLQSKFSGHRSVTIRRWRKEQQVEPGDANDPFNLPSTGGVSPG